MSTIKSSDEHLTINADGSGKEIKFQSNGSESVVIKDTGNVGIGTSSPSYKLETKDGDISVVKLEAASGGNTVNGVRFRVNNSANTAQSATLGMINAETVDSWGGVLTFSTKPANGSPNESVTERMRIDSTGSLLVGTTTAGGSNGITLHSSGYIQPRTNTGIPAIYADREGSDGSIIEFRKDGSTVGSIGSTSTGGGSIIIGNDSSGIMFRGDLTGSAFIPANPSTGAQVDNTLDVGHSAIRFDDLYATNGTIQTSDRNEKQDIEELSEAEQRVAVACKGLMRKFRWQDSVAEKGDEARTHFGIIAQDLQDAFTAEGLDAGDYAMFISTTWYEKEVEVDAVEAVEAVEATYDEDGNELTSAVEEVKAKDAYIRTDTEDEPTDGYTERTRLGVRYPELLAFIISAI